MEMYAAVKWVMIPQFRVSELPPLVRMNHSNLDLKWFLTCQNQSLNYVKSITFPDQWCACKQCAELVMQDQEMLSSPWGWRLPVGDIHGKDNPWSGRF